MTFLTSCLPGISPHADRMRLFLPKALCMRALCIRHCEGRDSDRSQALHRIAAQHDHCNGGQASSLHIRNFPVVTAKLVPWLLIVSSIYHHFSPARDYIREGSDIVAAFEAALGALDHGTAIAFSSGMAAVAAVAEGLPAGARIVMPITLYSGSAVLLTEQERLGKAEVIEVDLIDTDAVIEALGSHTDLLWIESPSNPLLGVADLPALIAAGHKAGATVLIDSTFTTPLLQRPLDLGADIAMHSVTKYIGGHSDLLMGALVASDPARIEKLKSRRFMTGALPGSLEAFLALRGIRTLPVRLQQHQRSALIIAQRLEGHAAVERVLFPGLPSFPGHKRAAAQQDGFGAMLSFTVRGGEEAAKALALALRLITHATSLGGVESLLERRSNPVDTARGSPLNLLRLSVGLEHVEDIWDDLAQALEASQAGHSQQNGAH